MAENNNQPTNRLIDNLFNLIRLKGQRAIAYSNDEKVRLELLDFLETVADLEVKIHQSIQDTPISKVLISSSSELSAEIMSELGPVTEIVDMTDKEGVIELDAPQMHVHKTMI